MTRSTEEKIQFTYSTAEQPRLQRTVIRAIEFLGGQPKLKRIYTKQQRANHTGFEFLDNAIKNLNLNVEFDRAQLARIPRHGPVLFVANHPYGVLDGIVLTWLGMQARPEIKVLANSVLNQAPEIREHLLPINFSATKEAVATTIASRNKALTELKQGGSIGIFPGGGVSTSPRPLKGPAMDLEWIPYTARLIHHSKATVVPIYFSGQNSRIFQLASHISPTLRLSLIFHETVRRMGTSMRIRIGDPIQYGELSHMRNREALVQYLRKVTFALAARPEIDWMKATKLPA